MRDVIVGFFAFKRASPFVAGAAAVAGAPFAVGLRAAGGPSGWLCSDEAVEVVAEAIGETWGLAATP